MHAIEFEAIAEQRMLRLPDQVPDGVKLRVLVLMDDRIHKVIARQPEVRPRRKPSPRLVGSVLMHDDLILPAVPEEDWDALK